MELVAAEAAAEENAALRERAEAAKEAREVGAARARETEKEKTKEKGHKGCEGEKRKAEI